MLGNEFHVIPFTFVSGLTLQTVSWKCDFTNLWSCLELSMEFHVTHYFMPFMEVVSDLMRKGIIIRRIEKTLSNT